MQVLVFVDNAKMLDHLPLFVSTNPDKMPSIKLTEGDLSLLLLKLSNIESNQSAAKSNLENISKAVERNVKLYKILCLGRLFR